MCLVTIDVGNTESVFGLWNKDVLESIYRTSTLKNRTVDDWYFLLNTWLKENILLTKKNLHFISSSVVPAVDANLEKAILKFSGSTFKKIHHKMKFPFTVDYSDFANLGLDRIANITATSSFYSNDAIIIDFGTAITFCYLHNNIYKGGCILPGIYTSISSLADRAANLTEIQLTKPSSVIGKNTKESLEAGIFYGFKGMIIHIIQEILKENKSNDDIKIIGTGGIIEELIYGDEIFDVIDQNLTLKGLYYIYHTL